MRDLLAAVPNAKTRDKADRSRIAHLFGVALCLSLTMLLGPSAARAQDFYKDKQVRLITGFPAGNDYDLGARLLAKI